MNKTNLLITIAIIFMAIACQPIVEKTNTVILSGKIVDPNSEMVSFTANKFFEPIWSDTAYADTEGNFKIKFELDSCLPVVMFDGKEIKQMYICPGDSLFISLDTKEFDESIHYDGIGSIRNNILAEYFLKFKDPDRDGYIDIKSVKDTSMLTFIKLSNQWWDDMLAFVTQQKELYELEDAFIRYFETDTYFTYIDILSSPWNFNSHKTDTSESTKVPREEIRQICLDAAYYEDPDWMCENFIRYCFHHVEWLFLTDIFNKYHPEGVPWEAMDTVFYPQFISAVPPIIFQENLKNKARNSQRSLQPFSIQRMIMLLETHCTDEVFKEENIKILEDRLEKINRPIPENATLTDLNDELYSELTFDKVLEKFKGNVVYLDFWGINCVPCFKEMPYTKKLSETFENEDFVVLYISFDYLNEDWERSIRYHGLEGLHYRLNTNTSTETIQKYNLKFIPHYVLIDKNGKLVSTEMIKPGDPATEEKIRELLLEE